MIRKSGGKFIFKLLPTPDFPIPHFIPVDFFCSIFFFFSSFFLECINNQPSRRSKPKFNTYVRKQMPFLISKSTFDNVQKQKKL